MILKVRMSMRRSSWRLYDNVQALQACEVEFDDLPTEEIRGPEFESLVIMPDNGTTPSDQQKPERLWFEANGKVYEIYTLLTAYVMNDSGETIDKLN